MSEDWKGSSESGDECQPIIIYKGLPSLPDAPNEDSKWQKFYKWLCPWLRRKRELGDEFLEAEVLNRKADAMVKIAEARKTHAEAEKIAKETAEIAARMEAEKLKVLSSQVRVDIQTARPQDLDPALASELEALEEKIKSAKLRYGVRILEAKKEPPQLSQGSNPSPP